jgi:pyrophosphate--fructose-6-phosphate 1-phosphotransferase
VKKELKKRKEEGTYKGKFSAQPLFCGYEGRSGLPSNFDCNYCYALGYTAVLLIEAKATGYIATVRNLHLPVEQWNVMGAPLVPFIHLEERSGKRKPVIQKAFVDLQGVPFKTFSQQRERWILEDDYRNSGPIQFFGPSELSDSITLTLELESNTQ